MRNRINLCKKMDFEKFDDRTLLTQGREKSIAFICSLSLGSIE